MNDAPRRRRLTRVLSWLVTLPLALVAVSFAVSNLTPVELALWPLPFRLEAPVYALVLVTLVVGFIAGGAVTWLGQHHHRKAERAHQRRADRLEAELNALQQQDGAKAATALPATLLPPAG